MSSDKRPFVTLACLCEKVLAEVDGAMSLIRVVDQFQVSASASPAVLERLSPHLVLTLVLALKGNGHTGTHEVSIQLVGETKSEEPKTITVEFPEGPLSAVNLVTQVAIGLVKNFGEKRFNVLFDGEFLTSVPFRVLPTPEQTTEVFEPK